jgi:hypothetical protein
MSALFTPEQEAEIARIAEIRASGMIGQALNGAAERIASALMGGPVVVLPLLHRTDIAAQAGVASPGKATRATGDAL